MAITLQDLADKTGLNISTISRALRDDPRVTQKTKDKVQLLANKHGYKPNLTARNLANGSTRTIWLLLPSLPFQIELELAQYAGPLVREQGYDLLVALYHGEEELYNHLLNRLNQGVADGAIIMPNVTSVISAELNQLIKSNFPLVFIDRYVPKTPIPVITTDQKKCSKELVELCVKQKVNAFIVNFEVNNGVMEKRLAGAIETIKKHGIDHIQSEDKLNLDLSKLKKYKKIAIIANSANHIRDILNKNKDFFNSKSLFFACYDTWPGDPYPGKKAFVCHQDFRKMAKVSVKEILNQVSNTKRSSRRQTFKIPALQYKEIDATI
jgi:DNA-binding LacI/PurR family transcriptional regulator